MSAADSRQPWCVVRGPTRCLIGRHGLYMDNEVSISPHEDMGVHRRDVAVEHFSGKKIADPEYDRHFLVRFDRPKSTNPMQGINDAVGEFSMVNCQRLHGVLDALPHIIGDPIIEADIPVWRFPQCLCRSVELTRACSAMSTHYLEKKNRFVLQCNSRQLDLSFQVAS